MAAPLQIRLASLDSDDPWIVEQKYFMILNDCLQPASKISAAKAAAGINELTPMSREAKGEEAEHPESWCLEFWGTFSEIVKQISYDHPAQDKMVEIMKELKALPGVEVTFYETARPRIWTDLPCLMEVWSEAYITPSPKGDASEFAKWVNWHAFSARVLQAGLADWFHLTTLCFHDALEEEHIEAKEFLDCRIRASAQWIEHSRDIIFHSLDKLPNLRYLKPGPLYFGKEGLSRERWEFWEARFRDLAENGIFAEETAFICGRAARQMAAMAAINGVSDEQEFEETATLEESH
ncbi:uncharacterized protein N7479_006721 [Penicillium vulpinum]|uniref:Uncharacterized protein n=1 Tax=Penicillium vulpinum TaxID=29845 RepID=A0A1V6RVU0_9EURO|nr:uncharacterized protein N7479_006721 [Penicillium vulpinum]KAJ5959571.1 hypothetical protein N7479_006721 [Penicillium vulpinum]OQE05756.1 hypothetical protein PENVUL_c022G08680 [Penicillium vulpinum]